MPLRYSYAKVSEKVEELLKDRLNKLGPISTNDAWLICKNDPSIQYTSLTVHFKILMTKMVRKEKADVVGRGKYFIYRNSYSNETATKRL